VRGAAKFKLSSYSSFGATAVKYKERPDVTYHNIYNKDIKVKRGCWSLREFKVFRQDIVIVSLKKSGYLFLEELKKWVKAGH
jgi:hypothetical protein